ncbi:MAG: flavin-containing monooxygenase [Beijerinckiaceae bacterium]
MSKSAADAVGEFPIVIIGGGFGGLSLGVRLKAAGIKSFTILEKSGSLGGVWRDNTYPGAACDVPSRFYSLSFEQDWDWSARFGHQAEILDYFRYCARKYGIEEHVRLNTTVTEARFDDTTGTWLVHIEGGETLRARALVSAIGLFNQLTYPNIPGRDVFRGPAFHSAEWRHDVDLEGKRVAVIGTGASAIQFVPEVAKAAGKLYVCQRSPQYIQPKDMGIAEDEKSWVHETPVWRRVERMRIYNEMEGGSGRRYNADMANAAREVWLQHLAREVPDPEKRRKLTPAYPFGCKRMLQSNNYYPAMMQDNVDVVDVPVVEITENAICLKDGTLHEVDVIIYGTGFLPTAFLPSLDIYGLNGFDLKESWKDGAEAYLGITVNGCPNFFMMYGPNTNAAASIIYMLEHQAEYIAQCVEALRDNTGSWMHVRSSVQRAFNEAAHERLAHSVVANDTCLSYFKLPSGKIVTQWPWGMADYHQRTMQVNFADYEFSGGDGAQEAAE